MARRVLGVVIFFAVGALVFAGLGWVTVAGLRVEEAQREAAAQAEASNNLSRALWRLELRMAPILTGEDVRPYEHYAADPTADGSPPSPLLDASLPSWMKLHFQFDPDTGWGSPQVLSQDTAERLRESWPGVATYNATAERAECLMTCQTKFPARQAATWLLGRERLAPTPEIAPPPPSSTPAPTVPANEVSANGFAAPESPTKDIPAPPAPPVENTPALGDKADFTRARRAETYRFWGLEIQPGDSGRSQGADGLVVKPELFGRGGMPPPGSQVGGLRGGAAPAPPAAGLGVSESLQLQLQQQPAANDPAPQAGAVVTAPRPSPRSGKELDNNDEGKIRADIEQKSRADARNAQYAGGRVFPSQNPTGNSATPNNLTPPSGSMNRVPPDQPRTPGDLYHYLKDPSPHAKPDVAGGSGRSSGPGGPPALPGPPAGGVAGSGAPTGSPTDPNRDKSKGEDIARKNVRPSAPTTGTFGGGGYGGGPGLGGPPGSGGFGMRSAPAKESKGDAPAKKRMEDPTGPSTENKLAKSAEGMHPLILGDTESLGAKAGESVVRFGFIVGLRYRLSELSRPQLQEKLQDSAAKPNDEQKRMLAGQAKANVPEERSQAGDRGTSKPETERLGGLQTDKATESKPLAEADGRNITPPSPKPEPMPAPAAIPWPVLQPIAVHLGPMRPQWLTGPDGSDTLVLVRVAKVAQADGTRTVYQGVVIDWKRLEEELRELVKDVLPEAKLVAVKDPANVSTERAMRALPVQLDPGPQPAPPPAGWTPLRMGLVLAWVAAVIAFAAVGFSSWSLLDLAERRIRFVSAVTHELRTPLTSLRLYLDLLLSGMVQDEAKRTEYLATLNAESDRLHRLIDNVLDFARLERRRTRADTQKINVGDLLETIRQTWADRCGNDGKELVVVSTLPPEQEVCTDPYLVGQIVGNLIDNARKYTRDATDPRIWLWAKPEGRRWVVFEVEDRGPGVPPGERRTIFRPFRRGDAADTRAGGAGLGLALAKQWAEALGGRLTYRPADGGTGACFRLELRIR